MSIESRAAQQLEHVDLLYLLVVAAHVTHSGENGRLCMHAALLSSATPGPHTSTRGYRWSDHVKDSEGPDSDSRANYTPISFACSCSSRL